MPEIVQQAPRDVMQVLDAFGVVGNVGTFNCDEVRPLTHLEDCLPRLAGEHQSGTQRYGQADGDIRHRCRGKPNTEPPGEGATPPHYHQSERSCW